MNNHLTAILITNSTGAAGKLFAITALILAPSSGQRVSCSLHEPEDRPVCPVASYGGTDMRQFPLTDQSFKEELIFGSVEYFLKRK